MKAVVMFFATAVAFACGTSVTLKFIINEVQCLHQKTLNMEDFDKVFVKDLKKNKMDSCEAEFFCQAEKVLSKLKKLPKCSDDDKLIRSLKQFNNRVNCTIPVEGDDIILRSFLDDLLKCARKVFGNPKN